MRIFLLACPEGRAGSLPHARLVRLLATRALPCPSPRAVKHNNILPNQHFRKQWAERVRTWLDQPKRKERRRRCVLLRAPA